MKNYFKETGAEQKKYDKEVEGEDVPVREQDLENNSLQHIRSKLKRKKGDENEETVNVKRNATKKVDANVKTTQIKKPEKKKEVFSKIHDQVMRDKREYKEKQKEKK